jgi:hypothetical protein
LYLTTTFFILKGHAMKKPEVAVKPTTPEVEPLYDLDGLMTDFPTARELEQFVFDTTGYVLNLKGRSNKFKYQTAMDVLNGQVPDTTLLGKENPYINKNEIVPVEPLKALPAQPQEIFGHVPVTQFQTEMFPHPDPQWAAQGQRCSVIFRKYITGTITYEIIGPIAQRAVGERINKFGQSVPEKYVWVDPRQGEQVIQHFDGRVTPIGTRLKNFMTKLKIGNQTQWETWIDREFMIGGNAAAALDNPWGL